MWTHSTSIWLSGKLPLLCQKKKKKKKGIPSCRTGIQPYLPPWLGTLAQCINSHPYAVAQSSSSFLPSSVNVKCFKSKTLNHLKSKGGVEWDCSRSDLESIFLSNGGSSDSVRKQFLIPRIPVPSPAHHRGS